MILELKYVKILKNFDLVSLPLPWRFVLAFVRTLSMSNDLLIDLKELNRDYKITIYFRRCNYDII